MKKAKEPEAEARRIVMMNKILSFFNFKHKERINEKTILKEKIFSLILFLSKSGDFYSGGIL